MLKIWLRIFNIKALTSAADVKTDRIYYSLKSGKDKLTPQERERLAKVVRNESDRVIDYLTNQDGNG